MEKYIVGQVGEVPPGGRKIVEVAGRSIGVFNVHGTYYALRNRCPHQAAPLCLGAIKGMAMPCKPAEYIWGREGEILRCPWHGWEFDITTGQSIFNPHKMRVRTYKVTVEHDDTNTGNPEADDPSIETYVVGVEAGAIVLHV